MNKTWRAECRIIVQLLKPRVFVSMSAGLIDYFSSADSIPRSQILFYEYYKAIES